MSNNELKERTEDMKQELEERLESMKQVKDYMRDVMDEIAVNCLHIRNELRKPTVDKSKIISYVVAIEEAIK